MLTGQWRALWLHGASAAAGGVAALGFASSHSIDLYAVVNQLNDVVAGITKLVAVLTPLVTGGYAIYKATDKAARADRSADAESAK